MKAKLTEVEALRDALNSRARLAGEGARGGALDVVLPPSLSVPHAPPPRSWEQPHAGDAPVAAAQAGLAALSCGAESPLPTSSPPAFFIPPARQATRDKHALLPSRSGESDLWTSHGASSTAAASPQPPPQPPHSSLMDVFNESYARHAGPTAGPITGHTAGPTPPPLSPGHRAVELPPGDLVDVLASGAPRAAPRTDVCVPSADDARADHARLHERLRLYGLREKTISGDGNCQFRALADQLWRDPARHAEVRARVMQQLRGDGESYEVFVTESWEGYLARMGTLGTWGDHLTLQAAADAYNVKLCLLTSYRDSFVVDVSPRDGGGRDGGRVLWLSFFAEVHYNSLYKA